MQSYDDELLRNPITGTACCCARAVSGQAAVTPPMSVTKSRRLMELSLQAQDNKLHHESARIDIGDSNHFAPFRDLISDKRAKVGG